MIPILRSIYTSGSSLGSYPDRREQIIPKIIIIKKIVSDEEEHEHDDIETSEHDNIEIPDENKEIVISTKEKIIPT